MGIEIVVGLFTIASMALGLFFPVVGWAVWTGRGQRLLLEGIERDERYWVTGFEAGDAATPVRMTLTGGGRRIALSAAVRGTTALWQLEVTHGDVDGEPILVVDEQWARGCRRCRDLPELEAPAALARRGYRLFSPTEDAGDRLLQPGVLEAAVSVLAHAPGAKELVLGHDRIVLEVQRHGLRAEHALGWLSLVLRLAELLDGGTPPPLPALPPAVAIGYGGSPVVVPGGPAAP